MHSPCCHEPLEVLHGGYLECADCGTVYTDDEVPEPEEDDYPDEEDA